MDSDFHSGEFLKTIVTIYGVVDGKHKSIVHSEVTMDDLFKS